MKMEIYRGKIEHVGDLVFVNDETVGLKRLEDWVDDVIGAVEGSHRAIEVRLKVR